jgi:hypothetical protein
MRGYLLLCFLMGGLTSQVYAQPPSGFVSQDMAKTYTVFDENGKMFVNPSPDVTGTPFYAVDWKIGALIANSNYRFDSVKVRLNLFSQEVHFMDRNNNEMALAKGYIKAVILPNPLTGAPTGPKFQNGFPAIDEQDTYNFYEVLAEGKLWLLHSIRKVIAKEKDEMSGEVKKEYRAYEDYYIFDGKTMQRVKKGSAIIDGKPVKYKNIDDLKKVIDQYNAL